MICIQVVNRWKQREISHSYGEESFPSVWTWHIFRVFFRKRIGIRLILFSSMKINLPGGLCWPGQLRTAEENAPRFWWCGLSWLMCLERKELPNCCEEWRMLRTFWFCYDRDVSFWISRDLQVITPFGASLSYQFFFLARLLPREFSITLFRWQNPC